MTSLTKVRLQFSAVTTYTDTDTALYLAVHKAQPGWRRVIAQAVLWGIPTPAFSTALAFFDGYRSEVLPANLIQAQVIGVHLFNVICPDFLLQRDYFGAHTFRVLPGVHSEKLRVGDDIRT